MRNMFNAWTGQQEQSPAPAQQAKSWGGGKVGTKDAKADSDVKTTAVMEYHARNIKNIQEIVHATYGFEKQTADVTAHCRTLVKDGTLHLAGVRSLNEHFGDTCVGKTKKLVLRYKPQKEDNTTQEEVYTVQVVQRPMGFRYDGLKVTHVFDWGLASKAGMTKNSKIVMVNGQSVDEDTVTAVYETAVCPFELVLSRQSKASKIAERIEKKQQKMRKMEQKAKQQAKKLEKQERNLQKEEKRLQKQAKKAENMQSKSTKQVTKLQKQVEKKAAKLEKKQENLEIRKKKASAFNSRLERQKVKMQAKLAKMEQKLKNIESQRQAEVTSPSSSSSSSDEFSDHEEPAQNQQPESSGSSFVNIGAIVSGVAKGVAGATQEVTKEVGKAMTEVANSVQGAISQNFARAFPSDDQKVDESPAAPAPASRPQEPPAIVVEADHPYYEQNRALVNMGFSDERNNMHMLAQSDGNLQRAITMLVENVNLI